MTVLATRDNPRFEVSRMEIDRRGVTYTVDTMRTLRKKYGNTKLYFIIGTDMVSEVQNWKNYDELKTLCEFLVVSRPNSDERHDIEIPRLDISSTDIRLRVGLKKPVRYLLPDCVKKYIMRDGLYSELYDTVKNRLSAKRFTHTVNVADEAVALAKLHGEDAEKAYVAGILHDIAKEVSDETHCFIGAEMARKFTKDGDIINAIASHTFGRADMNLLERIIYVADCTEKGRSHVDGYEKRRDLARTDFNECFKQCILLKNSWTVSCGFELHPSTKEMMEYYNI
jgi:nicotinate-nucleotide adenylyltransferase